LPKSHRDELDLSLATRAVISTDFRNWQSRNHRQSEPHLPTQSFVRAGSARCSLDRPALRL
jgi:hypothetical protein